MKKQEKDYLCSLVSYYSLMKRSHNYALIGKSLSHSFSKNYFEEKFRILKYPDYSYRLIELPSLDGLLNTVGSCNLRGFNVTIPYKRDILPFLNRLDTVAKAVGAVNTVLVERDKDNGSMSLTGYNTDAPALRDILLPLLRPCHRQALILGTGGAARAAAWALHQLGIPYLFVSRNPAISDLPADMVTNYDDACRLANDSMVIINATPVGMSPLTDLSPWHGPISHRNLCIDLIYNPSPTRFLSDAINAGATCSDGLSMLHRQADLAFDIWENTY